VQDKGHMDVIADLAYPLPLSSPPRCWGSDSDWQQLTVLVRGFRPGARQLPAHAGTALVSSRLEEMIAYFRSPVREATRHPREGLISALLTAEIDGSTQTKRK